MKVKRTVWIAAAAAVLAVRVVSAETATEVGSETCAACHSEKAASFNSSMHGKKIPLVRKLAADKTCEACHGAGSLHAAAAGDRSNPGFSTIKNPSKTDPRETAAVCFTCHQQKEVMLWSTSAHAQEGLTCAKCHAVHGNNAPKNLKKSANETCYQCHTNKKADMKLPSHHPLEEGKMQCVSCHNPHGGSLGNIKGESVEETCFKCHAEKAGPFVYDHPPVAEGCDVCHKPHGSVNDALLKQPLPYLCMRCHKWPHTERNNTAMTGYTAQKTNAYKVSGIVQRGRCVDCHREIHGSNRHPALKN